MSKKLEELIRLLDNEDGELTTTVNRVTEIPSHGTDLFHLPQGREQVLTWLEGQLMGISRAHFLANVILNTGDDESPRGG